MFSFVMQGTVFVVVVVVVVIVAVGSLRYCGFFTFFKDIIT